MSVRNFFIILILCFVVFFMDLGIFEPDLMESRNFITAREMIVDGNWIVPTMNGELRLEKQPFVTWLTALSAVAGNTLTDISVFRIPSALVSLLMVFFFYGICFEMSKSSRVALLGAIVFSTSLLVVQMARVNTWDIYTHAFMTGSIWLQIMAMNRSGRNLKIWTGAALLMGLSVFSKGPVSLYALWLPFIISYIIFYDRQKFLLNGWKVLYMICLALLTGFAWNIYIYLMEPDALKQVLDNETSAWVERHNRPFYFYFHFAVYIGIWAIPLLASFFVKEFRQKINESGNYKFILWWIFISLFLLSVIPEKKERYMLPMEIPMSLMVTFLLYSIYTAYARRAFVKADRRLLMIQGWLSVVLLIAIPIVSWYILRDDFFTIRYICGSVFVFILASVAFWKMKDFVNTDSVKVVIISSVLVVASVMTVFLPVLAKATYKNDYKDLTLIANTSDYKNIPFVSAGELNMKLVWRLGKKVTPVSENEFDLADDKKAVFFSYHSVEVLFKEKQQNNFSFRPIGIFDCDKSESDCNVYAYVVERKN